MPRKRRALIPGVDFSFTPPGWDDPLADWPPAETTRSSATCSWCHTSNPPGARWCASCGHAAQHPRLACDCPQCQPTPMAAPTTPPEPTTGCLHCGRRFPVTQTRWLPVPGEPDWPVCPDCYHRTLRAEHD